MPRILLLVSVVLSLAAAPVRQDPARTSKGQPIELDVIAVDGQGRPVDDLRPGDVEVWLEGYRIPVTSLTVLSENDERRRRSITLILDDMTPMPDLVPRIRRAATHLVERLEPGDRMSIGMLSGGGLVTSADPAALRQVIDRFNVRATSPMRAEDLGAHVFATLTNIARQVVEAPQHRKTIITLGPGWIFDTPVPAPSMSRNLRAEWTTTVRAMALSNIALYVLDPGGVGSSRVTGGSAGLARDTGGWAFLNTNDLAGTIDRVLTEASSFYIIAFEDPPLFRTAPLRKLELRTKRADLTLRARQLISGDVTR